jgi:heptaprenyl diphosphate synthase
MSFWRECTDVYRELTEVEKYIRGALRTRQAVLAKGLKELLDAGGKRIRPALVLISGQFGEYDRKKLMPLAAGIEILHMATLVHDDIIDDADIRRGVPTIQAKWGKDMAVFTGDFLLTRAFSLITQNVEFENMHKLSDVMKAICEGEIDQYQTCYNLDITVNDYLKRIGRKTALLFSLSCRIGAEESKCAPEVVWNLWKFGKNLGMVFQIIDDLLDFSGDLQTMGKSPMTDFGNGVITLPIIYALKQPDFRDEIREIIDRREFTPAVLDHVRERVHQSGGLDYSKALADRYIRRAINNLKALPKIPARDSLKVLVKKLQERQY